ncbi:thymidylate kinase [Tothia fuscella]|uniref:Thymidylate kinase n=1 Tax=Tothia fuscella TaxID=1048955 RepID=A0A9P4P429_9PEZI|nr:thymidylate kinase [Tothia fuscella]
MRGKLIVFEGLDRAGKSTQCERLAQRLQKEGHKVRHIRFPDRTTPIGKMIDTYLKGESEQEDHVIHLLFSANRWEAAASIKSDIESGTTVIIDRYYYSGCVYSAAKDNPSLTLPWARHPEVGLPRPDICLFLDISPEEAAKRGGFGTEKYEVKKIQDRVRELFNELQKSSDGDDFVRIDAGRGFEVVEEEIWGKVINLMESEEDRGLLRVVEEWE